jgi:hypothetical protein
MYVEPVFDAKGGFIFGNKDISDRLEKRHEEKLHLSKKNIYWKTIAGFTYILSYKPFG